MSETMPSDPTNSPPASQSGLLRTLRHRDVPSGCRRLSSYSSVPAVRRSRRPLAHQGGVVDVQEVQDPPGVELLDRVAGDVCHLLVDVHGAPLRVGDPDTFLRGLDDGAVPLLTLLQGPVGLDAATSRHAG